MHIFMRSNICHVRLYQIFPDITLILVSYFYLLINHIPFSPKILTNNTSTWVFIVQKKRCSSHHHIKQDLAVSDYTRYFQISRLISSATCICSLLHVSIYQVFFFSKVWHIKQVAEYLCCTRRNVLHIFMTRRKDYLMHMIK